MKTKLVKITFSFIFSVSVFMSQVQAQQVQIFNAENSSLPHNQITSIAIDAQGNKWFGTFYGEVVKFDDVYWTVYNSTNSGLPGEYQISSIAIDAQDNKWIGTSYTPTGGIGGGLVKFDNTNWTIYKYSNSGLRSNTITAIDIDSLGNKWIGTRNGGVSKFDDVNWTTYLPNFNIYAVKIDGNGNKWVSTINLNYESAVYRLNNTSLSKFTSSNSALLPYDNYVSSIAIDEEGNKWFGIGAGWDRGEGGLAVFDDENWSFYDNKNSGLPNSVYSIAFDKQGNKWFGTSDWSRGALVKFDGTTWTVYNSANSDLPDDYFGSIEIDNLGNIWFTTGNSGVGVFNENGITTGSDDQLANKSDDFLIYPNPANDFITVEGLQSGTLEIFSSAGAIIESSEVQGTPTKVDISNLPVGFYTVRFTTADNITANKFHKK